jgi:outer membrane protein TolC
MSRLEKIAQVRYASGLAAQQDVIRAQVEQTNMRSELVTLDSEARQVNARLNAMLARPAPAALAEPTLARPWPSAAQLEFSALEERVRSRNPQLFTEEARIKSAEKGRELAYKNRIPDFTLGIQPTQFQTSLKEWTLMLEVNIPLQQETRRAQERESEAMLAAARSRKEAVANQVLADLSENLAGIEAARRVETLTTTSLLPQAELTFNSALASYEATKVDFATLLEAQRAIRQARQTQIKARFEGQVRLAEIEKLLGEEL